MYRHRDKITKIMNFEKKFWAELWMSDNPNGPAMVKIDKNDPN